MEIRVGGKFRLIKQINKGTRSEIWKAVNVQNNKFVAVKIEKNKAGHHNISREASVYNILRGGEGISALYWHGLEDNNQIIVLDLLGPSLAYLINYFKRFSLKTILSIGIQLLARINFIHSKNLIHRDIKPDDIVVENKKSENLYIIDYGFAKNYQNSNREHIPYSEGKKFIGTARYASVNTHLGLQHSRRDDLEMLGYTLIYLLKGKLPWQNIKAYTKKEKYDKITEIKLSTMINILCDGIPKQFTKYMEYVRSLRFEERPEYIYLKSLFCNCLEKIENKGC